MQCETSLVCKLLVATLAEILLLARMSGLMINQIRLCLEAGIAGLTNERPVIRVYQLMPLKQLLVLETSVTFVANKTTSIVVLSFFMIHNGTGMV